MNQNNVSTNKSCSIEANKLVINWLPICADFQTDLNDRDEQFTGRFNLSLVMYSFESVAGVVIIIIHMYTNFICVTLKSSHSFSISDTDPKFC